jgi:hopanoid biosynthesis associated protein HpnK
MNSCPNVQAGMRARNLIVNADDLGWTPGVNRGIAEAHRNGIVTSTSLLANGSAFADGVRVAQALPSLGVGVHLNLSDGLPIERPDRVPSLLGPEGEFLGGPQRLLARIVGRRLSLAEAELEWDAQIRKVRELGIRITHLDGHKHVHMLPGLFRLAVKLAKRHHIGAIRVSHEASALRENLAAGRGQRDSVVFRQGVQARGLKLLARDARALAERNGIATSDRFCGIGQTGELTREGLARLLARLPEGTTELMCHPGYADEDLLRTKTRLQASRASELAILTDPYVRNLVASQAIRLIDYAFLAGAA